MTPAVALITCPPDWGASLARGLVEAGLAACVQVDSPVKSFYSWKGAVQEDTEVRLVVKTSFEHRSGLEDFLKSRHPYEVPQLILIPAQGAGDYLKWWAESLASV